jgi:hypothetical protein
VTPNPAVKHPSHYGGGDNPYEVIKVAEAWGLDKDAYLFNVLKYVGRAGKKDDILQDLEKAAEYIQFRIATIKRERTAAFVFPVEPHSVISALGHPCTDTVNGRTSFVLTGAQRWMCDCSTWPETTIRQDLTDHRIEAA